MLSPVNLGLRHLLVIYPFLALLGAYALLWLWQVSGSRTEMFAYRSPATILVIWTIATCVRATPDFIPYFNELAAPYGSRILIDSDFDWGQDLNRLSSVLQQQHVILMDRLLGLSRPQSTRLTSLATASGQPRAVRLDCHKSVPIKTKPGDYGWLEKYKPERIVGKTIRLYHFDVGP